MQASILRHPERIHPALWRGSQLARSRLATISTGFTVLDQELPSQGWPLSSLIELMPSQPGIGEMQLLRPALAGLSDQRSIALVHPPYAPHFHCWVNWQLGNRRLLWIRPQTLGDTLWAAEQILKHNACSALFCWADSVRPGSLRRLHLAAQQSDTLLVLLRPPAAALQASAAPLRLSLAPSLLGLEAVIIKRRGPCSSLPIPITFYPTRSAFARPITHAPLDQPLPTQAQRQRIPSSVVG